MKLDILRGLSVIVAGLAGVWAIQKPFQDYALQTPRLGQDDHNQTLHLSSLSSQNGFISLSNPRFPAHQVRIKKTNFCDPTVK